ncbi:hypothetical protein FRC07_000762 [Ceratobasidium sp. 392]|nr:hypothetical protein FRC07_000762 [Ceratobasidium sp. 392]
MATRMWDDATQGEVWLVLPESKTEGYESDYGSSCDTDSTDDTMTTIQSREVSTFFRIEYGRAFPAYEEIPMVLPADDDEINRLRIQHHALKLIAGETLDKVISPHLLSSTGRRRKGVLDVRTQTGIWAEGIAARFPEADVKSVDVVPTVPHVPRANLEYEVYDIHQGILEADATFDIVHARHSLTMVKDWQFLLKEMHRVLHPGGLFVFGELYPQITLPGEHTPAVEGPANRLALLFEDIRTIVSARGVLFEASHDLDRWLCPGDGLWGSDANSGFHSIVHRVWELPINGLWHSDPLMQEVGRLMSVNVCEFVESTRPIFLSSGLTNSDFDEWLEAIRKEIRDPMNNAVIRYHLVCAYKQ